MTNKLHFGAIAALAVSVALAGCSTTRFASPPGSSGAGPVEGTGGMAPTVTSDGTQQFAVPQDGRSLIAQRLVQLVPGPILAASISNGWRTSASAQARPNDYAACVSATNSTGAHIFVIVKSNASTGDVVSGPDAAKRCGDRNRVIQWVSLPEAVASAH